MCLCLMLALPAQAQTEEAMIQLYKQASPAVVQVMSQFSGYSFDLQMERKGGSGSGFVVDTEGHIVTNYHVVDSFQRFYVVFNNQDVFPAQLVGFDPYSDLAVLKVTAPSDLLRPVHFGDYKQLQVGQTVMAIGSPYGLRQSATLGIISALGYRTMGSSGKVTSIGNRFNELIQIDADINHGNSGGPLFNTKGEVIGVNTLGTPDSYVEGGTVAGLNFAIPIDVVKRSLPDMIAQGYREYPWLGANVIPLNPSLARIFKLPQAEGLLVQKVFKGSSASKAGLKGGKSSVAYGPYDVILDGDVITHMDGQTVATPGQLTQYLENHKKIGEILKLRVIRQGISVELAVTLLPGQL